MMKPLDWKKLLSWTGKIILIPVIILEILFAALLVREAWLYFLYPIKLPVSAQLSDFEDMTLLYNNVGKECEGMSDVTKYTYPTFEADIFNPESYFESLTIDQFSSPDSAKPINFVIGATKGHITSITYVDGKKPVVAEWDLVERGGTIQATAFRATSTLPRNLVMNEQFCGDNITIMRSGTEYNFSFGGSNNDYRAARISLNLDKGEEILLVLYGPIQLPENDTVVDKLEISFLADGDMGSGKPSIFMIGAEGYDLTGQFPWMSAYYDQDKKEYVWDNRNSVTAFADGASITAPIGKVQFGTYKDIELYESLAAYTNEELEIPLSPQGFLNYDYQSFNLSIKPSISKVEISGNASELFYRKQSFGFSRWTQLPGYVQAGVFGLLIGAVPAGVAFLRKRLEKQKTGITEINQFQLGDGDFVCVLESGGTITGTLVKLPGFFSPYYVLHNAHRKQKDAEEWDREVISEINIKSSRVEQYYFFRK